MKGSEKSTSHGKEDGSVVETSSKKEKPETTVRSGAKETKKKKATKPDTGGNNVASQQDADPSTTGPDDVTNTKKEKKKAKKPDAVAASPASEQEGSDATPGTEVEELVTNKGNKKSSKSKPKSATDVLPKPKSEAVLKPKKPKKIEKTSDGERIEATATATEIPVDQAKVDTKLKEGANGEAAQDGQKAAKDESAVKALKKKKSKVKPSVSTEEEAASSAGPVKPLKKKESVAIPAEHATKPSEERDDKAEEKKQTKKKGKIKDASGHSTKGGHKTDDDGDAHPADKIKKKLKKGSEHVKKELNVKKKGKMEKSDLTSSEHIIGTVGTMTTAKGEPKDISMVAEVDSVRLLEQSKAESSTPSQADAVTVKTSNSSIPSTDEAQSEPSDDKLTKPDVAQAETAASPEETEISIVTRGTEEVAKEESQEAKQDAMLRGPVANDAENVDSAGPQDTVPREESNTTTETDPADSDSLVIDAAFEESTTMEQELKVEAPTDPETVDQEQNDVRKEHEKSKVEAPAETEIVDQEQNDVRKEDEELKVEAPAEIEIVEQEKKEALKEFEESKAEPSTETEMVDQEKKYLPKQPGLIESSTASDGSETLHAETEKDQSTPRDDNVGAEVVLISVQTISDEPTKKTVLPEIVEETPADAPPNAKIESASSEGHMPIEYVVKGGDIEGEDFEEVASDEKTPEVTTIASLTATTPMEETEKEVVVEKISTRVIEQQSVEMVKTVVDSIATGSSSTTITTAMTSKLHSRKQDTVVVAASLPPVLHDDVTKELGELRISLLAISQEKHELQELLSQRENELKKSQYVVQTLEDEIEKQLQDWEKMEKKMVEADNEIRAL